MSDETRGLVLPEITLWEEMEKEDFQKASKPFQGEINKGHEKGYQFNEFSQDLFSSMYKVSPKFPNPYGDPKTQWARNAFAELEKMPEFSSLREADTKTDAFRSGLAATILTKHFAEHLKQDAPKEDPQEFQEEFDKLRQEISDMEQNYAAGDDIDEEKLEDLKHQAGEAQNKRDEASQAWEAVADQNKGFEARQMIRRAVSAASEKVDEMDEQINAFGIGKKPGDAGYTDPEQKMRVAKLLDGNRKLSEIAKLAGRFQAEAKKAQRNKIKHGYEEVVDIETGNNIERLLPSEIVKLGDETLELLFYKGYCEQALLQYRLESTEKQSKGPIVFCIDNSGSMSGQREIWSKAIMLAIAQIAMDQRRTFEVIHFDSRIQRKDVFPAGTSDPEKLIESCAFFSQGGTDITCALRDGIRDIRKGEEGVDLNKADLICITDGQDHIPEDVKKQLKGEFKELGVSLFSIILGGDAADLDSISDYYTRVDDLHSDKDVKTALFSI